MGEEVSVIMAVYNGEAYLSESIESILKQTYPFFEFIIVNDGSSDGTREILNNIKDPRVKVYHLNKNNGTSYARNYAVEKATNRWILLQDDDDISVPTRIEIQMNYIKDHPEVISVLSNFQLFKENVTVQGKPFRKVLKGPFFTRSQLKNMRFYCPWVCYGSALVSKQALLQAGGYDNKYRLGEDYDLFLRLIELGPIDMVRDILYQYRYDSNSMSRSNRGETRSAVIEISLNHIKKMFEKKGSRPSFGILGSMGDCENFVKNLSQRHEASIEFYLDCTAEEHITVAYYLFKNKIVNGIIVLDRKNLTKKIIRGLIKRGMTLNTNLFHLKKFRETRIPSQ